MIENKNIFYRTVRRRGDICHLVWKLCAVISMFGVFSTLVDAKTYAAKSATLSKTSAKVSSVPSKKTQTKNLVKTATKEARVPPNKGASGLGATVGAASGMSGENKALEVRGQARSLQMMMLLKSKSDDIHFVKPRKDFRPEIDATAY